jgi:hypothetical protein
MYDQLYGLQQLLNRCEHYPRLEKIKVSLSYDYIPAIPI